MEADTHAALIAALRLQLDWGVDEALAELPLDRSARAPAATPGQAAAEAEPSPSDPDRSRPATPTPLRRPAQPARLPTPAATRAAALAAGATSLAGLREAMAAFDGSPLRETATNLVFADGVPDRASC
ncbi:hypothetical protein ACFQY5_24550 [Paeniroseomonas aquatica]|uniref:hypothetical protein n=1 Tax=Paeniroseomonas aquatica TaxID=373043 RepID=UPI0036109DC9